MIVRLARQAIGSIVSVFALLGFAFVPLGDQTGFEHAKAILATPEATRAFRGLVERLEAAKEQAWKGNDAREPHEPRTPHRRHPVDMKLAPTRAAGAHTAEPSHAPLPPAPPSSTPDEKRSTGSAGAAGD
ncbi:MAG: hypothetical protein SFV15_09040 [Polyangiaceae bacterium]|nr:hypothetical protein [Polyangiaceae bacterium]